MNIKLLSIDIETTPIVAHVWGLWKQNIGINQIIKSSETLCFAAKWYNKDDIIFLAQTDEISKRKMVHEVWKLLDEADAVMHYNGNRFDTPTLNDEFTLMGLNPPTPFKQIDLMREVKKNFRLPSYKLDFVSDHYGLGRKVQHEGHELWIKCMQNDPEAWKTMQKYNEQDTLLLERLYDKIRPWIKVHPNMGHYVSTSYPACYICGSTNLVKKGVQVLNTGEYQRYRCKDCGKPLRGQKMINTKEKRENLTLGV